MMFTGGSHYKRKNTNQHDGRGRRHERQTRNTERGEIIKVNCKNMKIEVKSFELYMEYGTKINCVMELFYDIKVRLLIAIIIYSNIINVVISLYSHPFQK